MWESIRIAILADAFEVDVAPHNYYGHLSTLMSAHFCAAVPNFRIMEYDVDDVPWRDDIVTHPPVIENGQLVVPTRPGLGHRHQRGGRARTAAAPEGMKIGPACRLGGGRLIYRHIGLPDGRAAAQRRTRIGRETVPASIRAIDCDIHPDLPGIKPLLPYLDDPWRETIPDRGIESLDTINYPPGAPLDRAGGLARRGWARRHRPCRPAGAGARPLAVELRDLNCLAGVQLIFNEDMARALARAVNDWIAREWLDRTLGCAPPLSCRRRTSSIAVEEIERCAADRRFVQVLLLAMDEEPLGQPPRAGRSMPRPRSTGCRIGIHAGSAYTTR